HPPRARPARQLPARVRARVHRTAPPVDRTCRAPGESMSGRSTETDLVTGAFSYSGSRIAELLIASGREVRTLTHHPDREHPLRARVQAEPYRFDDELALTRSFEGITTLYNTYWVRFERGPTTFANAVTN